MTKVSAAPDFAFHENHFGAEGIEEWTSAEVDQEVMLTLVFVGARQIRLCSAHGTEQATA